MCVGIPSNIDGFLCREDVPESVGREDEKAMPRGEPHNRHIGLTAETVTLQVLALHKPPEKNKYINI